MALSTPALLVATGSTPHNVSTATSAAFTPTAGALLIVAITGTQNVTFTSRLMSVKSSAGYNLSEILFLHRRLAASGIYIAIYVAKVGSSPPSQTITATWDNTVQSVGISVCEITGHDLVQPVLSSFHEDGLAHGAVAYAGTWPTTPNTNNTVILIGAVDNNTPGATDITTGTGWTAITSAAYASDFVWTHWQYRTGSTSTSLAFNNLNDDGFSWAVAGIEVQVDQGAPSSPPASSMPGIGRRLKSSWGQYGRQNVGLGLWAPYGSTSTAKAIWTDWWVGASSTGGTGTLSATEEGDTLLATGALAIDGDASITEGSDTLASTGALALATAASITEADDASAAAGALAIAGALSATEADDTLAAAGATAAGAISGVLAATEADDALSVAGALAVAAAFAATEADDALSASSALAIAAAASISEAADTLAAASTLSISGALAVTESDDVLTAAGEGPGGSTPTDGFWVIRQMRRA